MSVRKNVYIRFYIEVFIIHSNSKWLFLFNPLTDVQEWYREPGQTIESALMENSFCDFPLEYEPLGESLAIKSDSTGFYTTSDWQENAPIYSYHFKC